MENSKENSKNLSDSIIEETEEFAKVFKSLDSNSKQFLAGYIVAKNEQHGIKQDKVVCQTAINR